MTILGAVRDNSRGGDGSKMPGGAFGMCRRQGCRQEALGPQLRLCVGHLAAYWSHPSALGRFGSPTGRAAAT